MKFNLVKIRLNQGGYDSQGNYYGNYATLYRATACESIDGKWVDFIEEIRASDRWDAKEQILHKYPTAKFYR